ncbi:MAG: hypothetical protein MI757_04235 [Pirellulales bacterium]|nr:hypothetical protein [Pirellulales bacterium]
MSIRPLLIVIYHETHSVTYNFTRLKSFQVAKDLVTRLKRRSRTNRDIALNATDDYHRPSRFGYRRPGDAR